jgi:hypothetical protein
MNEDDIRIIRDRISALKNFRFHGDIHYTDFDGVYVSILRLLWYGYFFHTFWGCPTGG